MLERFGFREAEKGKFVLDNQRAVDGVTEELSQFFNYPKHTGLIELIAPGAEALNLRRILQQRGNENKVIEEVVKRANEGVEIGGCAVYTGDLDLGFDPKPMYMVFISTNTRQIHFPFTLGEEITHGEHATTIIAQEGISYQEYKARFSEVTEEFIGYIGRKRIINSGGLKGFYKSQIDLDKALTLNEWAHLLSYFAVDELNDKGKELPVEELFHASNETVFWRVLLENTRDPVELNFQFPPDLRFEKVVDPLNDLLKSSKANEAVKLIFSYR